MSEAPAWCCAGRAAASSTPLKGKPLEPFTVGLRFAVHVVPSVAYGSRITPSHHKTHAPAWCCAGRVGVSSTPPFVKVYVVGDKVLGGGFMVDGSGFGV